KMESVCLMTASCISENNSRARRLGGPECSNIRGVTESEIVFIGRGDIAMLLQAAAENVAVMQGGLMSRGQRDHGIFRRVFSGMTAAGGDAAAEKQFALGAVENDVSRRFGAKALGFLAVLIQRHMDARNGFGAFSQRSIGPV